MDQCFLSSYLPVDHRSYRMFNEYLSPMNDSLIQQTNNLLIQNIDEPMSTRNLDSKWITFDRLGKSQRGGGSDVCVLSERDQSGVNCQARGQSGNEKVLCIICTLLPEILVSLLSPLFLIYNSIVFRKSDPGLDIRDTIKYVLLILIHLFLKSSLRHIFLQHANPCIFQNVYAYF